MEQAVISHPSTAESSDRELIITRIFDAPRALVFKAWTEPERQVQWLGPQGFTSNILKRAKSRPVTPIATTCVIRRAETIGSKESIAKWSTLHG